MSLYTLLQPLLFKLDPEQAHRMALKALGSGTYRRAPAADPSLAVEVMGLRFPSPVGLAAGMDKDAEVPDAALGLGFGFAEVGTVTPEPQPGNPQPRVFRLTRDHGLINRLGFNNSGFEAAFARLSARRRSGLVGVNVGANKDSDDRIDDYRRGVERFAAVADYMAINISSPNTPGLRDLQGQDRIEELLAAVAEARDRHGDAAKRPPILVKISPDIEDEATLATIVEAVRNHGLDGMIVSNTTLSRDGLSDPQAREAGGLSGRPLFERATRVLARTRLLAGPEMALIGVGGVDSPETAWTKLAAGADLVQLYTGLVYEGPDLPARINEGLAKRLKREGLTSISEVTGTQTDRWAEGGG